ACETFACDARVESFKQQPPAPPVPLESMPAKWGRIRAGRFEWQHPRLEEKLKVGMIIDQGCRVRVAKWLCGLAGAAAHRNPRWNELKGLYEERWPPYFGKPQRFKCGREGAWMDEAAALYFDRDSDYQEVIPDQAHWRVSSVEEATRATRATMDAPVAENHAAASEEAPARVVAAGSPRADVRGHSSLQRALGRAPDMGGKFFESDFVELPYFGAWRVEEQFDRNYNPMFQVEQECLDQVCQRRISGAVNSNNRMFNRVAPGMFVRYYRKEKSEVRGTSEGLARALAAETARTAGRDGSRRGPRPTMHHGRLSSVMWPIRGGRLTMADLAQLRAASAREVACAEVVEGSGVTAPWAISRAMEGALPGQCMDVAVVDPIQWEEDGAWSGSEMGPPAKMARVNPGGAEEAHPREDAAGVWQCAGSRDMSSFVANQIKKGRCEVSERAVTIGGRGRFADAEQVEVNDDIASSVLEVPPPDVAPPPSEVMRMGWVMKRNIYEKDGGAKPIAILVLGCMDPQRGYRPTSRGDMWVVPELAGAMGVPEGAAAKLEKAARGLVEAAIDWYMTVSEVWAEQGWARVEMDPRAWVLRGKDHGNAMECPVESRDVPQGRPGDPRWLWAWARLGARFDWKEWGRGMFYQTGVHIVQDMDTRFKMDQEGRVRGIEEIYVRPPRKNQEESWTTDAENTQMRAVLGAIGWRSEQTEPVNGADVSWQLSNVPHSSVKSLEDLNKLVDRVRGQAVNGVRIHGQIDRVRACSAAAKTRATVDGELCGLKLVWLEMLGNEGPLGKPKTAVFTPNGKGEKVGIDAMATKGESARDGNGLPWVHRDAQLANGLTRGHEPRQLRLYYNCGARWKLVHDEKLRSARRRGTEGVGPLDSGKGTQEGKVYDAGGQPDQHCEGLVEDKTELETEEGIINERMRNLENFPS
ncbi:unnamed protein product, partial [Prorocentrum cordatum]